MRLFDLYSLCPSSHLLFWKNSELHSHLETSRWLVSVAFLFKFSWGESYDTGAIEEKLRRNYRLRKSLKGSWVWAKSKNASQSLFLIPATKREEVGGGLMRWISFYNISAQVWASSQHCYLEGRQRGRIRNNEGKDRVYRCRVWDLSQPDLSVWQQHWLITPPWWSNLTDCSAAKCQPLITSCICFSFFFFFVSATPSYQLKQVTGRTGRNPETGWSNYKCIIF